MPFYWICRWMCPGWRCQNPDNLRLLLLNIRSFSGSMGVADPVEDSVAGIRFTGFRFWAAGCGPFSVNASFHRSGFRKRSRSFQDAAFRSLLLKYRTLRFLDSFSSGLSTSAQRRIARLVDNGIRLWERKFIFSLPKLVGEQKT